MTPVDYRSHFISDIERAEVVDLPDLFRLRETFIQRYFDN